MNATNPTRSPWYLSALLVLALGACHDARRENPLDPELTPPVTLEVAFDDSAGSATLSWTPYEGSQSFAAYWVLQQVQGLVTVDTLTEITDVAATTYTDTSLLAGTAYEYRVSVVNTSGLEIPSTVQSLGGYAVSAVSLVSATGDPLSGSIALRWNRYQDPSFGSYRVRRRVVGSATDMDLATLTTRADTVFRDTSAVANVDYLYRVDVLAAGSELSGATLVGRLTLPSVHLDDPVPDSVTATGTLRWEPYEGPRFAAYQIWRSGDGSSQLRAELPDHEQTTFLDSGLAGNTDYSYHVVVRTTKGEEQAGNSAAAIMHELVASWALDLEEGGLVRLYAYPGQPLTALVSSPTRVRLVSVDREAGPGLSTLLIKRPRHFGLHFSGLMPHSVSKTRDAAGRRWAHITSEDGSAVVQVDEDGSVILGPPMPLHDDEFQQLPVPSRLKGVTITADYMEFDRIALTDVGGTVFVDDFDALDLESTWDDVQADDIEVSDGRLIANGDIRLAVGEELSEPTIVADIILQRRAAGGPDADTYTGPTIRFGGTTRLSLSSRRCVKPFDCDDTTNYEVRLVFSSTDTLGYPPSTWVKPYYGLPYRLSLGVPDGVPEAWLASPVVWPDATLVADWLTMVAVGDRLLITSKGASHLLDADGESRGVDPSPDDIGEMRVWETGQQTQLGYTIPSRNQVAYGQVLIRSSGQVLLPWSTGVAETVLGERVGDGEGQFLVPLSLDRSPDGRLFVLDAGNGRIQVFDADGDYITQWGRHGSGPGQFDFGSGLAAEDFSGSIAVDEEGFIYVADVGNRRIQKFAP